MTKRNVHVVPHGDGWATRRAGSDRVSRTYDTQTDAYAQGRRTAQRDGVEVVTHRPDGRIRDSDSFGNDPNPPKDKKH